MSCGCTKNNRTVRNEQTPMQIAVNEVLVKTKKDVSPTEPCLECVYKHFSEAWVCFNEYTYENANRRFICGSLRAVVLHSFKNWEDIAKLARECALLIQHGKDKEAAPKMEELGSIIDKIYLDANPDIVNRIEALKLEQQNERHPDSDSAQGSGKPDQ